MTLEVPDGCVGMVRMPYDSSRLVALMNNVGEEHGEEMLVTSIESGRWMIFFMPEKPTAVKEGGN